MATWYCNYSVDSFSEEYVSYDIDDIPECHTAVVLGTSKKLSNGRKNMYFEYRIRAAARLYYSGKVKYIIVSGDNSEIYYNEPRDMKKELIKRGIPENKIYQDYAAFRTLDAVVRANEIFSQKKFIIVSQEFHNKRAVFLARKKGLQAFGYNAKNVNAYYGFKTQLREVFARVKAYMDIYLINTQPKFLGEKVIIGKKQES